MKTKKKKRRMPFALMYERLFTLELRVARRADELVGEARPIPGGSLECWLKAEREVFAERLSLRSFHRSWTGIP